MSLPKEKVYTAPAPTKENTNLYQMKWNINPTAPQEEVSMTLNDMVRKYELTMGKLADDKTRQYLEKYGIEGLNTLLKGKSTGTLSTGDEAPEITV